MKGKTRGIMIQTNLMNIENLWGKEELEKVLHIIGIDSVRSIKGMDWYKIEQLHEVFRWISENKGPQYIELTGIQNAQQVGAMMKIMTKLFVKEEKMFRQFGTSYKEFFDFGTVNSYVKGKSAVVQFKDCAFDEHICRYWYGTMNGIIQLKWSDGMAYEIQCQRMGAPYCEFIAYWGPDATMTPPKLE